MGATTYLLPQECRHCHWFLAFVTGDGICQLWQMHVPGCETCFRWQERELTDLLDEATPTCSFHPLPGQIEPTD